MVGGQVAGGATAMRPLPPCFFCTLYAHLRPPTRPHHAHLPARTTPLPTNAPTLPSTPSCVRAGFPCFKAGAPRVLQALERRFAPQLSEPECVQHVLSLICDSLDAWRTRQYDQYQ